MGDHWKACKKKKPYRSWAEAERARAAHERQGIGGELVVYQCMNCWHWHVGHMTDRLRQASNRRYFREQSKQASGDTYAKKS